MGGDSQYDRHVILWHACKEVYQRLRLTPAATEPDAAWHAREMADARCFGRLLPRFGKGALIAGGRLADRFSDPTLALRVQEAEHGDQVARRTLLRIAREALDVGRINDLPLSVRLYLKEISAANGGKLPAAAGGRPPTAWKLALAAAVEVERARGLTTGEAIDAVAKRASRETIRKAHNRLRNSREVTVELARRRYEAAVEGLDQLPPVDLKALRQLDQTKEKAPRRKLPKV